MMERIDAPERTLAFLFSGKINANDVDAAITQIESMLEAHPGERINLYAEIHDLTGMTLDALVKDLRYGLGHFGEMTRRVGRMAVVAEADWLRAVVRLEARLLPRIELRAFELAARDEAMAWAAEGREAQQPSVVRMLDSDDPGLFAFALDGMLGTRDAEALVERLHEALDRNDSLRVLARIDRFEGFDPRLLLSRELWSTKLAALRQVERYAMVGGPEPFARLVGMLDPLLRLELRHFAADDERGARRWLRS